MDVDEGQAAHHRQLGMAGLYLGDHRRESGEHGDAAVMLGTLECRDCSTVASGRRHCKEAVEGKDFLEKNQVRFCLFEKREEAAEVGPAIGVEREDGEDGGRGLPVISIASRHQSGYLG